MRLPGLACFLAWLLLFDVSTPLLPGAYQFDPDDSVEALRARSSQMRTQTLDRQSVPVAPRATQVVDHDVPRASRSTPPPARRVSVAFWRLPRAQAGDAVSPVSEDH
ncbi:MAG: hypothetical protein HY726_09860 [Candidatus Rokubacteria bacterium]|nr:hypothetical protein [Candidatus Rokubacteria bacterium]